MNRRGSKVFVFSFVSGADPLGTMKNSCQKPLVKVPIHHHTVFLCSEILGNIANNFLYCGF